MKRETYLWILLIIGILAVALYFRYFYQPTININLGMNTNLQTPLYPYQKTSFAISVFNNGSSYISNMSIGVIVNGNLTKLYKIFLPAGKQSAITFNYSPTRSGVYNVSAVADPGKLYNIANRQHSQVSYSFTVSPQANATPSAMLPNQSITSFQALNLTSGGYLLSGYIADQYNLSRFAITSNTQLNLFLKPVLNLTAQYIKNITTAQARYKDNSSVYSIWIKGYVAPNIFSVATTGLGLNSTQALTKAGNTTFIKIANSTTLCSWYSGGWLKVLATAGGKNCAVIVNATAGNTAQYAFNGIGSKLRNRLMIRNTSFLANYSGGSKTGAYASTLSLLGNASFVYTSISNTTNRTNLCYGQISTTNTSSYCSYYIYPTSGRIGSLSLIETTGYRGAYNTTAISLVNTTLVSRQIPVAIGILQSLNISGSSLVFQSGLVNRCSFNQSFVCRNLTYQNGMVSFKLTNNMTKPAKLNNIRCYTNPGTLGVPLNILLGAGSTTNMTATCYNFNTKLNGTALGLNLHLLLNYTSSNSTHALSGNAFVPFG